MAQDKPAGTATAAPKAEKKICRTYGTTGSILGGKRICHTKSEWAVIDGANADTVERMRNAHSSTANSGL